jgi:hypothetical protein
MNVSAYGMGGASVYNSSSVKIGTGYIWNDQNTPHTLYGETHGTTGNNDVGIRVRIAYTDQYGYSRNAYSPSSTTYLTDDDGYVSTSVYIASSNTPVTGYGYYKVEGYTASSSRAWNFG